MLRQFLLLTAVVCCNACRLVSQNYGDTTSSPLTGCTNPEGGTFHAFESEWQNGDENCVCVDFGIICCQRYWDRFDSNVPPEPTIIADDFGAFTDNDVEVPIPTEEPAATELIADDSPDSAEDNE